MLQEKKVYGSDLHFGHNNIIKYCKRPWTDVKVMDSDLLKMVTQFDQPDISIIHMGDFAFRMPHYRLTHSKNHLHVMGNHDKIGDDRYSDWFGTIVGTPNTWRNHFAIIEDGKYTLLLSHAPQEDLKGCDFNIYGHTHNSAVLQPDYHYKEYPFLVKSQKHLCACIEILDFQLRPLDEVIEINKTLFF